MPLLPLKLRILRLLPGEKAGDLGAGDHLPHEGELLRRLRRRRYEEEILILVAMGEMNVEQANQLLAA